MAGNPPVECPKCGHRNDPGAAKCANCRITLKWALEYWGRGVPGTKTARLPLILHADDHSVMADLVRLILGRAGYRVSSAKDGYEALEMAENLLPDLILMDTWMPEMDGLEALERLKANPALSTIPVVMLAATRVPDVIQRALDLGAEDYWYVPIAPALLVKGVAAVLGIDAPLLPHVMLVQSASPSPLAEVMQFLLSVGYSVSTAKEGESALRSVQESVHSRPIAILAAFNLSDMSGLDLLARLKADPGTSDIPVVMLAKEPEPELHRRAVELGAHGTYTGPFDAERLLEVLRAALADEGDR